MCMVRFDKPIKVMIYFYLLHQGPTAGYEMGKQFKDAIKNGYWDVPETKNMQHPTKLYPILAEMEEAMLIKSVETQNKKEYIINPAVLFCILGRDNMFEYQSSRMFESRLTHMLDGKQLKEYMDHDHKIFYDNPYVESFRESALSPHDFIKRTNYMFKSANASILSLILYFREILRYINAGRVDPELIGLLPVDIEKQIYICSKIPNDKIKPENTPFGELSVLESSINHVDFQIKKMVENLNPVHRMHANYIYLH